MVLPITGPFVQSGIASYNGPGSHFWERISYRQKRPYDRPLGFRYTKRICTASSSTNPADPSGSGNGASSSGNPLRDPLFRFHSDAEFAFLKNDALKKFNGSIADRAEWLINLHQRREAISMITTRTMQLLKFTRAVRRMDFIGAHKALFPGTRGKPPAGWRQRVKTPANLWLEFHFGWKPLIQDIGTSVDVLQSDFSLRTLRQAAKVEYPIQVVEDNTNYYTTTNIIRKYRYTIRANVQVTNPNLYLANRLGLTNPALVVWDAVPFSFVVDWFVPVGQFLSSFTEYLGLSVSNTHATLFSNELCKYELFPKVEGVYYTVQEKIAITCDRQLTIPEVTLTARFPERISVTRAATAVSLLLQGLRAVK